MRGESTPPTVLDEFTLEPEDGEDTGWSEAEKAEVEAVALEQQAIKEAEAAGEPNRAWRNRVKKSIRAQIKATESQKALAALKPNARDLFARRHATYATDPTTGAAIYAGACACERATIHEAAE